MVVVAVVEALAEYEHFLSTFESRKTGIGCRNLQISGAVVKPTTSSVHQPRWVQGLDNISQGEFWILAFHNLAPALVVDNPGDNTRIATVLGDQEFQLALEFLLLLGVRKNCFHRAVVESPGL